MKIYFLVEQRVDGASCSDRISKIQDFSMYLLCIFIKKKKNNMIKGILMKQISRGTKSREYNLWQLFVELPTFY